MKREDAIRKIARYFMGQFSGIPFGDKEARHFLDFIEKDIKMVPPINEESKPEWEPVVSKKEVP